MTVFWIVTPGTFILILLAEVLFGGSNAQVPKKPGISGGQITLIVLAVAGLMCWLAGGLTEPIRPGNDLWVALIIYGAVGFGLWLDHRIKKAARNHCG